MTRPLILALACLCLTAQAAPRVVPADLTAFVAEVRQAAQRRDHDGLRQRMVDDFTWSFGGDASAAQAIEQWRSHPKDLEALTRALQARCAWVDGTYVQCPVDAGTSYRAGFKRDGAGWKMAYFVAGD